MNSIVKSFLAIALCLVGLQVQAQYRYAVQSLTLGFTQVAGSTASNSTAVIDCRKQSQTGVELNFQGDNTGTDYVYAYFAPSVDGVNYDTTRLLAIRAAANGNTAVTHVTNLVTSGIGYLKLSYITNASETVTVTNVTMRWAIKFGG